jgi:hypothetical protein
MTRWNVVRDLVTLVLFYGTICTGALIGYGYGL